MDSKAIGKRINDLIAEAGIRKKDLAEEFHCQPNLISMWCSGTRSITLEFAVKLAERFNTTTDYILGLSSSRTRPASGADTFAKSIADYLNLTDETVKELHDYSNRDYASQNSSHYNEISLKLFEFKNSMMCFLLQNTLDSVLKMAANNYLFESQIGILMASAKEATDHYNSVITNFTGSYESLEAFNYTDDSESVPLSMDEYIIRDFKTLITIGPDNGVTCAEKALGKTISSLIKENKAEMLDIWTDLSAAVRKTLKSSLSLPDMKSIESQYYSAYWEYVSFRRSVLGKAIEEDPVLRDKYEQTDYTEEEP